jgi:dTDP-glucose 4,6-dehydratase
MNFEAGLARTIERYGGNPDWLDHVRTGAYRTYYESNYGNRTAGT